MSLLLAAATLALYLPVRGFSFLGYDDEAVLTANPHLRGGLSWTAIRWAFSTPYLGNWVPVTFVSHLADVSLFGMSPGAHHLVNAALHALTASLLFVFLRRATGSPGRSAAVAAIFALHPLHVQSVAWVTLRRDVLMGLFCVLALLAWERWLRRGSTRWYLLSLAAFASGVMSKPLLVTLPLLLLVLDWWPFGRLARPPGESGRARPRAAATRLLVEKTPFLLLSLAAGAVSFRAQAYAMAPAGEIPFAYRAMNAAVSVVWYLAKSLWPSDLAILYPHPQLGQSAAEALLAALLLGLATALMLRHARRLPWLLAGWLWFLIALFPTVGLLAQVGEQSRADRYIYLPLLGISWAAVWGLATLAGRPAEVRRLLPAGALLVLAGYAAAASVQLRHWKDDFTVFERAREVTRENYVAETHLGGVWVDAGRHDIANRHLREALRIFPGYPVAHNKLGIIALKEGRLADAEREFRSALARDAGLGEYHRNLGAALSRLGRAGEAVVELRRALALGQEDVVALHELGLLLARSGEGAEAVELLRRAATLAPENASIRTSLGLVLTDLGRLPEGEAEFRECARLRPEDSTAANNLGMNLARQGRIVEAQTWFTRALALDPENRVARENLEAARRVGAR